MIRLALFWIFFSFINTSFAQTATPNNEAPNLNPIEWYANSKCLDKRQVLLNTIESVIKKTEDAILALKSKLEYTEKLLSLESYGKIEISYDTLRADERTCIQNIGALQNMLLDLDQSKQLTNQLCNSPKANRWDQQR